MSTAGVFDLTARTHTSRVLARFNADRERERERDRQAAARVQTPASPQALSWAGVTWDEFLANGVGTSTAVNEQRARGVSAVTACSNVLGGSIASLPLHFYKRAADGSRTRDTASPLWWLFNERPYANWSAAAFWQYVSDSRMFHGDAFALLVRSATGDKVIGVEPWHPGYVHVDRDTDGRLVYEFHPRTGIDPVGARVQVREQDDVLHIPSAGFNGLRSPSMLRSALNHAAGIAAAADDQAAQFMADGARPDFAIELPGALDTQQKEDLRNAWLTRHTGQGAKKAPVILAGGMKLHQLTMSSEDAQLLQTRGFQVEEICRVLGVPPFLIGHTEKTTSWGSGVGEMGVNFVKYTLSRHLNAIEQELNYKLFRRAGSFCEFLTAGLERGDIKSRFEAYRVASGRAGERSWMRPSEIRALENLPPDPALDTEPINATATNTPAPAPAP